MGWRARVAILPKSRETTEQLGVVVKREQRKTVLCRQGYGELRALTNQAGDRDLATMSSDNFAAER